MFHYLSMIAETSAEDQISYLRGCLPLRQFEKVISKSDLTSEETVQELIYEGKTALKLQMESGRDHWDYLKEELSYQDETLLQEKSYRELAYYAVAMGNSLLQTRPYSFDFDESSDLYDLIQSEEHTVADLQDLIIENSREDVKLAFSDTGRNIWDVLSEYPELRIAYLEDENHLYLEFWSKAKEDREFHERRGEFLEFPVLRKLDCRIHLDDGFIELRGRNDRIKDRETVLEMVEKLFGNAISIDQNGLEIRDETIRYFMTLDEFVSIPHASKDGAARSSWTSDSDVRNDDEYPDHRPHNYGNMVFELDSVGRASFQLSADDNSFRVFLHKITPDQYRAVTEYIWENVNAANN